MLPSLSRILVPALAATTFAAALSAQCQATGTVLSSLHDTTGVIFDVVNVSAEPIVITGLDQHTFWDDTSSVSLWTKSGSWNGSQQAPAAWTLLGSNPAWSHFGVGAAQFPLGIPIAVTVPPGTTQAFYVATPNTSFTQLLGYLTGVNQLGTVQASDGTIQIRTGVSCAWGFGSVSGLPTDGVLWLGTVHYCKAATNTVIGTGCGAYANSFYAYYPDAAAAQSALSGNVLRLAPTANGYVGTWENGTAAASFVPPTGAALLATGDDGFVPLIPASPLPTPYGTQPVLSVSGNGIVAFGPFVDTPGTPSFLPASVGFLQSTNGGVYAWHDCNATEFGSGAVWSHYAGNTLCVTFLGVESYPLGVVNPSTLQFQFDLTTGAIAIVFVDVDGNPSSPFGSAHLVGVTAPGASNDPGAVDLATAILVTASPEGVPLSLAGTTTPVLGANWQLQTNGLPAATAFGLTVIGFSDPGLNDLASIGMPGCGLRASLDILTPFAVPAGTPSYSWSIAIPANAPLGFPIYTTTVVAPDPATNALGLITSNGIRGLVNGF